MQNQGHQTDIDTYFVDVLLPVPMPNTFTYRVPQTLQGLAKVGCRAVVMFGAKRVLTAIIVSVHMTPPEKYQAKYVVEILDETPSVTPDLIWLYGWIASYYMCYPGEVMNMALPAGLKISSLSKIQIHPSFDSPEILSQDEMLVFKALEEVDSLTFDELERFIDQTKVVHIVRKMISKNAILVYDEINENFKPKFEKRIRLSDEYKGSNEVLSLIQNLEKKEKQQDVLLKYLAFVPLQDLENENHKGVSIQDLKKQNVSESALNTLAKNGILEVFQQEISRFKEVNASRQAHILSDAQVTATKQIFEAFREKDVVLFRGVTGSGKTEVYVHIIQQILDSGSQVLLLLPEIALTTQIVSRLRKVFGSQLGVYHSKFSDNERVEVWNGVLSGKIQFVVGVRSAIFLPFQSLALAIVDEEHEPSYKQYEPAPRYHARDVSIVMAQKIGFKVLLGSATPSIESYYQAQVGKYGFVELLQRFGNAELPKIELINLANERKEKTMVREFSSVLFHAIDKNLAEQKQSILFLNRRGYSTYLSCQNCQWIGKCSQCAVSLTYHLSSRELICHYCGHHEEFPKVCPDCGAPTLRTNGLGTEKLEDDIKDLFPHARVGRMDVDTTKSKTAHTDILEAFENNKMDILVGTQMVSKGLDFDNVNLVGVFNVDKMINFPDFRSPERTFHLITQVSGRAGRRNAEGVVLIQTSNPEHTLLKQIQAYDYESFYESEIQDRQEHNYPPFVRMIQITLKNQEQLLCMQAATKLAQSLEAYLGKNRILGPEKGLVERIRNKYIYEIWVKLEKDKVNMAATKSFLINQKNELLIDKKFKSVQVIFNVDAI
ncbi:MAG: replication restart helicase PriA [Leadbetterella sp.]